ncbi:MAG TPA: pyridoxine 5'-phosphate synthase [bacterium]
MRRIRLGVNIDHVATLRQARRGREPEPVAAAALAELGGADQITVHLREDRRHIQDRDLELLRRTVATGIDMEMAAVPEMVRIARRVRPELATLVPEKRQEITTEGGLDVAGQARPLGKAVAALQRAGIRVSLFVDPAPGQVLASRATGADAIELNTGQYAEARTRRAAAAELEKLRAAASLAAEQGLAVFAGHGLNYHNILPVRAIPELEEVNIGHSIVSRALFTGLEQAVRDMVALLRGRN